MNQVIEELRLSAKQNGYITFDTIIIQTEKANLGLIETEKVIGQLLDEGFLVLEDKPSIETGGSVEDSQYDKSQLDYEKVFDEIIRIDSGLTNYINRIRKIPAPRLGEEGELIVRAKKNNKYARKRLILMFLKIVVRQALFFHKKTGYPLDEAIQEGNIGLIKALRKFKIKPGARFSTYAPWWIRQNMQRAFFDKSRIVRLPVHMYEQVLKIRNIQKEINTVTGNAPTNYDIAIHSEYISNELRETLTKGEIPYEELNKSQMKKVDKAIKKVIKAIRYGQPLMSLDETLLDRNTTLAEIIPNNTGDTVYELVFHSLFVKELLSALSDREQKVLILRHGLYNDDVYTLEEIGEMEGVTRERIRQIESKAFRNIKRYCLMKGYNIRDWI